ncbi:hypothetical protein JOF42_000243 [Microbacterium phyllosphaerae]|uniref:DUF4862 domain-containing protein n=1 Tax=Microbacterium phyllosphaerae TaxID=124798 RepID=A0ABS4WLD1_9MICO|nr:DUF4862 family protein [Microbacterium phyllosphaerae]MBP2376748.1 hypothetical protein [Microbacterium phyllosphaerae]
MTESLAALLVSSYAVSPAHTTWDPDLEGELLPALCALPGVVGLEVPWMGRLHPHDPEWFLSHVPAGAELAVTPLPWVMKRCGTDARYGIASPDDEGRRAAVDDLRAVAGDVRRIGAESDASVTLVALHTAPQGNAAPSPLVESLAEISQWDWAGAQLVIEHCDAAIASHAWEKGFLSLDEEIGAILAADASLALWLNWGRSVIETRDADAVTEQIARAVATGLLSGLTFSGSAAVDGPYGSAWADGHLPLATADPESGSLLDDAHVAAALAEAGDVERFGLKVSRRPCDRTVQDLIRTVADNLDVVRAVMAAV